MPSKPVTSIHFDQAFTHPGEAAGWTVVVHSDDRQQSSAATIISKISHLDQALETISKTIVLSYGDRGAAFKWQPPAEAPRGYGLDVSVILADGSEIAHFSCGFDVLNSWTQMPRYGFLSDFYPGRADAAQTLQQLADTHVNGLQFYDWMYRHEDLLTDQEPYIDVLGRELSLQTVNALIDEAHKHNIAAMPYTAIYGCSIPFYNQHQDWGLYYADGKPVYLGTDFLAYMDPRPDSKWTNHLLDEFKMVLENTQFDGIHLDQYGDPKEAYDAGGNYIDMGPAIAATITKTHALVDRYRSGGAVIFNCVSNWPVELASKADEDFIYIEVWEPLTSFADLHQLIAYAQSLGTGKPVVLAAYVHPENTSNPLLMDAIIFASGGGHIELGENSGYLAHPYFPYYEKLSPAHAQALKSYYDFAVRYQNLIGPSATDATNKWDSHVRLDDLNVGLKSGDEVFALARETPGYLSIGLVNLTGIQSVKWNEPAEYPKPAVQKHLTVDGFDCPVKQVFLASPDEATFSLEPVEYQQEGDRVTLLLPSLKIWDLIVFAY